MSQAAHAAVLRYTEARLREEAGSSPPDGEWIRAQWRRALADAGLHTTVAGPAIDPGPPPTPEIDSHDPDLEAWTRAHPAAGRALERERTQAATVVARADDQGLPTEGVQAYWDLRIDRTAAAYSVLNRLTETPASSPRGPLQQAHSRPG